MFSLIKYINKSLIISRSLINFTRFQIINFVKILLGWVMCFIIITNNVFRIMTTLTTQKFNFLFYDFINNLSQRKCYN